MKRIDVEIRGTTSLLMHSAHSMQEPTAIKNPAKRYVDTDEAEKVCYRDKKGFLIVPSRCLKQSILNASTWYKIGRNRVKPILAGCTRLDPEEIQILDTKKGKPIKKYEIDKRPVNVQGNRVIRARPRIDDWQLKFQIIYNEDVIPTSDIGIIEKVLLDAGTRVGLLDNRPQKYGEHGTFEVTKFKPVK